MSMYLSRFDVLCTREVGVITDCAYPQRVHWFPDTYKNVKSGFVQVAQNLVSMTLSKDTIEHVKKPVKGKSGLILAAGSQTWGGGGLSPNKCNLDNQLSYAYRMEMLNVTNIFGARIAATLGISDYVATDASTCASSLKALMDAKNLIDNYGFGRVVIVGMEDSVCNMILDFFGKTKASLCLSDEQAGAIPSAFDSEYGGFNLGQGVVIAVIESEPQCWPRAKILGVGVSAEEFSNPLGQRQDGQGYQRAIEMAIEQAMCDRHQIRLVKTHGTGTPVNNAAEKAALLRSLPNFIATSYKQWIGHTVGASGLLETCLMLEDIRKGEITPIKNRTEKDEQFISDPTKPPGGLMLSLAAGMGNIYAAAVLKYENYIL